MSLSIQPSLPAPLRSATLPTGAPLGTAVGAGAGGSGERTQFSPIGILLAQLQGEAAGAPLPLPAPGSEIARELATLLAQRLGVLFRQAGLPTQAPVAFDVGDDGRAVISGQRGDVDRMQAIVDAHPDVQALVRVLHAINAPLTAALALGLAADAADVAGKGASRESALAPGLSATRPPHPWAAWVTGLLGTEHRQSQWGGAFVWLVVAAVVLIAAVIWLN